MSLEDFYALVESKKALWIEKLAEAVAIKSVSADASLRPEVCRMMDYAKAAIEKLGGRTQLHPLGKQTLGGVEVDLPPILTAELGSDAAKPTILLYGHLDVQPASKADGWNTEPFELTVVDGKMFGRGSTDDKGPVLAWLWAIQCYQELSKPLPINIKFLLEGMEESGSVGLEGWIKANPAFFKGVHASCISDNYFLGPRKPCVTYGLRGLCYFSVEVTCAAKDLHSGVYGGPTHEATWDLVKLLASLTSPTGEILVPGIMDTVRPFTDAEKATYADIDFKPEEFAAEVGVPKGLRFGGDKTAVLAARWRFPTLSIHGIEGAWAGEGAKTVIPKAVKGKFSLRIVPDMEPGDVCAKVTAYLQKVWADLASPNTLKIEMLSGAKAWLSDVNDANYVAARTAIERVHGVKPDLTREGGSIPFTLWLQEATGTSVMLLPIGGSDDSAHSQNEKLDVSNYIQGIKVLGTYIEEVAKSLAAAAPAAGAAAGGAASA